MRRREFVQIAATVAAWPLAARAQQKSLPTVGYLGISSPTPMAPLLSAFHEGLRVDLQPFVFSICSLRAG